MSHRHALTQRTKTHLRARRRVPELRTLVHARDRAVIPNPYNLVVEDPVRRVLAIHTHTQTASALVASPSPLESRE